MDIDNDVDNDASVNNNIDVNRAGHSLPGPRTATLTRLDFHSDNHHDINHLDHQRDNDDDYGDQVTSTRHPGHLLGAGRPGT